MINPFNDCVYDKGRWKIYRQEQVAPERAVGVLMPKDNWSRHFARVIAETVKRIKNKDSNAAVLRSSYGLRP